MLIRKLSQRGDTIIEVMVALSVLALAFAISYATASHALQESQNSEEHSQALQVIASQLELAREDVSDSALFNPSGPYFCLGTSGVGNQITPSAHFSNPSSAPAFCHVNLNGQVYYTVYVQYQPAPVNGVNQDVFTFSVSWPGIGDLGQQREQLSYKLHEVTP